jgi:hypothetical protein
MKFTKVCAGNYRQGEWNLMHLGSDSWIVWNTQTQTSRFPKFCRNTKWFFTLSDAKKFVCEQRKAEKEEVK